MGNRAAAHAPFRGELHAHPTPNTKRCDYEFEGRAAVGSKSSRSTLCAEAHTVSLQSTELLGISVYIQQSYQESTELNRATVLPGPFEGYWGLTAIY